MCVMRRDLPKARAYKKRQEDAGERAETSDVLARTLSLTSPQPLPISFPLAFAAAAVVDAACAFVLPATMGRG